MQYPRKGDPVPGAEHGWKPRPACPAGRPASPRLRTPRAPPQHRSPASGARPGPPALRQTWETFPAAGGSAPAGPAQPRRPGYHSGLSQPQGCSASRPHSPANGPGCGRRRREAASPRRARGPGSSALTLAVPFAQRSATGRQQEQGQRRAKPVGRPHPASPGSARRTGTTGTTTPRRLPPPPPPHWPAPRPAATLSAPIGRTAASTRELAAADWGRRRSADARRGAPPPPLPSLLREGRSRALSDGGRHLGKGQILTPVGGRGRSGLCPPRVSRLWRGGVGTGR